jgi:hypothetical protein
VNSTLEKAQQEIVENVESQTTMAQSTIASKLDETNQEE